MTWEDRINSITFSIQTGDGLMWFPLWKGGEKETEFNTSSFNFINVYGTLVDRKKTQGGKFPLVFWFEGEDNITQADRFEASCDDPRAWTVIHPLYGQILGQPISIKRDDSNLNVTEISIPFWETIDADYPTSNFSVKDNTMDRHRNVFNSSMSSFDQNNKLSSIDIPFMADSIYDMSGAMQSIQDGNTYADFQNALNSALKATDNLLSDPLNAIQNVQNFLDLPSVYIQAIEGRIASYENIYWRLKSSITTITEKKYFESIGASVISCICVTVVNPITGDYVLVSDVDKMVSRLKVIYNDYLATLDTLSVSIYDVNKTYIPDATVQSDINSLVIYTIANLFVMAFESKREYIVYTTKKTNAILLTHRYLGLDDNDTNLSMFIKTNNIKFNELFSIDKGREIRYSK